ncbi:hypothetical protein IGI04_010855 [Brassica rapa subsp. trilocularis]|uniref:Ataxin-2 C-terminal domain-containing protein n=1 Tax=Brassica rapa subsp. trilocularis TaxID=1813537 RepID=A0ABQ7N3I4_BRACM|nr:hypothetical protein IGI04_010855 [Brassica rapa subsp. trilocularis]
MATIKKHEAERLRAVDLSIIDGVRSVETSKPFQVANTVSLDPKAEPLLERRKRPSNSEYIDINEPVSVSVSSGLAPASTVAQQTLPQGMIPMWAFPSNAVVPTVGAFFLVQNPSNQPRILAYPAATAALPATYVAAVQQASSMARPPPPPQVVPNFTGSVMAPSSSSSIATKNMLRDFSLESYNKKELHQFMTTTAAPRSSNH